MRTEFWIVLAFFSGAWTGRSEAQVEQFQLGGAGGQPWADWTDLTVLTDDTTHPTALQPLELKPDRNIIAQIGPWYRWKFPTETQYRQGNPRIWRAINYLRPRAEPREFIDGDPNTAFVARNYRELEFYTFDLGTQVPVERFDFYPPEGADPLLQEPFRPNFAFKKYELSASNDVALVRGETGTAYRPLDLLLSSVDLNTKADVEVHFPLQLLRFLRISFFPDDEDAFSKFALAEMEVYGRGIVPRTRWESRVVDLGQVVNIGQVFFGVSPWRREEDQLVAAPQAPVSARVEVKTGLDDTPIAYFTYNDLAEHVEVDESRYERLSQRSWPWDPKAFGWRGPIADDDTNWSYWSTPIRQSGQRPRVPPGRYLKLQVKFETDGLWEFARMDSLVVQTSPLLAERVLGEVAVAGDLQPEDALGTVQAGVPTEFVCDLRADFSGQAGFDAVRVMTPAAGSFIGIEMGEPLAAVQPDQVVEEAQGFVVFLSQRVSGPGEKRLRLWLQATVFSASAELAVEVFDSEGTALPQGVEAGDVSEEVSTNQLRVVARSSSLGSVLTEVVAQPAVFTPQGDGINDQVHIGYTLFRVLNQVQVEVKVYSLGGQQVRHLSRETQGAGRYRIGWDGRDDGAHLLRPGIYLVRVRVDTDQGQVEGIQTLSIAY